MNYVRFNVACHNVEGWTPEKLAKEIKEHLLIRLDADYDSDVEVEVDETA